MNRRALLLAPLALIAAAAPLRAQLSLDQVSAYLNALTAAQSDFAQVNADGTRDKGRLFIARPNRMRFEYDGRDAALVLASSGNVAIFDAKSNQPPEQYPLRRTPLSLILGPRIDLTADRMVVAHGTEDGFTTVTAQDPDNPDYGSIKLFFTESPIALRKWLIVDQGGGQTLVLLDGLQPRASFPASLFDIRGEIERRSGR